MIFHKEFIHDVFGRCVTISNSYLTVTVTVDIGPRIIEFRRNQGKNILFQDSLGQVIVASDDYRKVFGKDAVWNAYGGHRVWKSPETYESYYPDNNKVFFIRLGDSFVFKGEEQMKTNVQVILTLDFVDDYKLKVTNAIKNIDIKSQTSSCWALTMVNGPGLEIVPLPRDKTDFRPQRHYSLWDFGARNNDPRAYYGDKFFTLTMDTSKSEPYKVGILVTDGVAIYLTKDDVFTKQFFYNSSSEYPDNNVNYETYVRELFLEMETLSPLKSIQPGESLEQIEFWSLGENHQGIPNRVDETSMQIVYDTVK